MNKIYFMGAGAVGTYYGALMARAGLDITLITRGAHFQALRQKGAVVKSSKGEFVVNVNVSEGCDGLAPADLVVFVVKSYDTEEAALEMRSVIGESTTVLTIQNGIDNPERIASVIGAEKVLPGFTKLGVNVLEPGVIRHIASGEIYFNERDGKETERVRIIRSLFRRAGIPVFNPPDIRKEMWKKFLWNCTCNIAPAITGLTLNRFYESSNGVEMLQELMGEVVAVAKAEGVLISAEEQRAVFELGQSFGEYVPSTLADVRKKKRLEVESFTGAVVRLANKYQISVPINSTFYRLMKVIEHDIEAYRNTFE